MNHLNLDLETNRNSSSHHNNVLDQVRLLNNTSEENVQNNPPERLNSLEYSIIYNGLAFFVPVTKISASLFVLFNSDFTCFGMKQMWLLMMMIHDICHLYIIGLRTQAALDEKRLTMPEFQFPLNSFAPRPLHRQQEIQLADRSTDHVAFQEGENIAENEHIPEYRHNAYNYENHRGMLMSKILDTKANVKKYKNICIYLWIVLAFLWLKIDLLREYDQCANDAIDALVTLYVIIGWLWFMNPVLLCLVGCLCVPILVMLVCIFNRPDQTPANRVDIQNLPVIEYHSDIPGNKECAICIAEYEEKEKIIQLGCSPMHHFHEDCVKSWLKLNGLCPICRSKIGTKA